MLNRLQKNRFYIAVIGLFLLASPIEAALVLPAGETVWQGDVEMSEPVRIPRGSSLVIKAGTRVAVSLPANLFDVSGQIRIEGTADNRVKFASPEDWRGINFVEAEKGSSIVGAHFKSAESAISSIATDFKVTDSVFIACGTAIKLLRESAPLIENNRFEANDIAIDNEMRSAPTIRHNIFRGHKKTAILASHNSRGYIADNRFENNEQGIGLLQTYPDKIENNVFSDNKIALYCNQTKNTPLIKGNLFERNKMALVNYSFAYPAIEDNRFIDNEMAIRNDQYGSPLVQHNLLSGNKTAIYNYRKSNPTIENNRIEKSDLAIFCDYSSYPRIKQNNFSDNKMAVELGIYQSADWEKRSGSKPLMQKEALARKSKNQMLSQAPTKFSDVVDVSNNWWGTLTTDMAKGGGEANLSFFQDRLDREWVTYEGFGPDSYRIDKIVFHPWLNKPVEKVGPR